MKIAVMHSEQLWRQPGLLRREEGAENAPPLTATTPTIGVVQMARTNVADPTVTETLLEGMILASDEIATYLAMSRDRWEPRDAELSRLIDGLRVQFVAFSAAAKARRIEHLALRTISRAYVEIVTSLHELETDADADPVYARECIDKASEITGQVFYLVGAR